MRPVLCLLTLSLLIAGMGCGSSGAAARPRKPVMARPVAATSRVPSSIAGSRNGSQAYGEPIDESPLRVLFVGASVTEGWFASTKQDAYPSIVTRRLEAGGRRVQVRMLARAGATAEETDTWDLEGRADVVVLQMATNDFVRGVPLEVFSASYADVLHRLRTASPEADMICMGGWDDPNQLNGLGIPARYYDLAAKSVCQSEHGRYVDLSAVYMDPRNHGPIGRPTYHGVGDDFHPNDRGHAELASLVLGDARPELPPAAPAPVAASTPDV